MFKWISWVARMGATALLLSFLCIWTTGYIVNSYMETVIKQLDLPIQTQPFALSGLWGTLWGAEKAPKSEAVVNNTDDDTSNEKIAGEDSDKQVKDQSSQEPSASVTSQAPEDDVTAEDSVDEDSVFGNNTSGEPNQSPEPGSEASADPEAEDGEVVTEPALGGTIKMGQLTDTERQALYAMVVSKLNQDQLKLLSDSLQGGLTAEELVQVQEMLKNALTDEEYTQMIELLEGKTAAKE